MVRYVTLDRTNFEKKWERNSYGLLLGHRQDNNYNIFLPLECPEDSSIKVREDVNILMNINPKWVSQHFLNVFRMLPGNVHVIGCYCVCTHQSFVEATINGIQILNCLWSKENKLYCHLFEDPYFAKIFLLIDPLTQKFICKQINFQEQKHSFKNVDIKHAHVLSEYAEVQSNIVVRIDTVLSSERDKDLILKQLKDSVNPFIIDFVSNSVMLVNGQQMDANMPLGLNVTEGNKNGNRFSGDILDGNSTFIRAGSKFNLTFTGSTIQPTCDLSIESDTDNEFEIINRVKIQGRIPGVGFLYLNSTVKEAEIALKMDLVRSIYSRLELLTEELHITGGEMEVSHILLPQRVKVMLPICTNLPLCDYKFLSETASDVISRVRYFCRPPGMTDEQFDINCIDIGIERSEQTSLDDELSDVELSEENNHSNNLVHRVSEIGIIYFVGVSTLVFCISVFIYYTLN